MIEKVELTTDLNNTQTFCSPYCAYLYDVIIIVVYASLDRNRLETYCDGGVFEGGGGDDGDEGKGKPLGPFFFLCI